MGLKTALGLRRPLDPIRHLRIGHWVNAANRLRSGFFVPYFFPSFTMTPPATVFTVGSCFARHIETRLQAAGFRVPVHEFSVPESEYKVQLGGATLNKFTPATMRQEIEWAEKIFLRDGIVTWDDCRQFAFTAKGRRIGAVELPSKNRTIDLMFGSYEPVSESRFIERRQQIYDVVSTAFHAPYVIMTPGLVEAWQDKETGLFIQSTPFDKKLLLDPERFRLEVLSYEKCLNDLKSFIAIVRRHNPAAKFILTTSPVPLARTFRDNTDVVVANSAGKATLRAACAEITSAGDVDYFPSYEAVLSAGIEVWQDDLLHVREEIIARITAAMLSAYAPQTEIQTAAAAAD